MENNRRNAKPKTMQIAVYGLLLIIVIIAMFGLRHMSKGHVQQDNTAKENTSKAEV